MNLLTVEHFGGLGIAYSTNCIEDFPAYAITFGLWTK